MDVKERESQVLLAGAGNMGMEYARVLDALNVSYTAVTRGEEKAITFEQKTGHRAVTGGIEKFILNHERNYNAAIVALPVPLQKECVLLLIKSGIRKILLEKPGSFYIHDLQEMNQIAKENNADIKIAYNRRFYNSVLEAEKLINEDGGISSIFFEFTELYCKKKEDLQEYFMGNSTHVMDLAFYFGGMPKDISGFTKIDDKDLIFTGAGITEKGILFSYMANYCAPGRWGVEVMTPKHRLIFRPMEKLHIQELNSFRIYEWEIADQDDILFKPGLYKEVKTFLYDMSNPRLLSSEEQEMHMGCYNQIMNF
ncbi:Gfo/Idh/MocA family oxidoreductase [Lachnospiraceae bacterium 62-35]